MGNIIPMAITFSFLGAMAVLVILNAKNFAVATGSIADLWTKETQILSGSGYVGAK